MLITRRSKTRQPLAMTIGNFDGVHLGHQAMLAKVKQAAERRGYTSCAMTFEPHPREFLVPDQAPVRLTSLREKLSLLAKTGIARVQLVHFNSTFASIPASTFISKVLRRELDVRWLLIGDDFRFGANRSGDHLLLQQYAAQSDNFELEIMASFCIDGLRISSTAVRQALASGNLSLAKTMLGRDYCISGRVVDGDKLGKKIGYPTANICLEHNPPPLNGIFVVEVTDLDGLRPERRLPGVVSLGTRPTIRDAGKPVLEVHLFDFDKEIYGHRLCVHFLHKLREEVKFANLDGLIRQIAQDVADARQFFLAKNITHDIPSKVYSFHS